MSDWFFMLGEPLGAVEQKQARAYLAGLNLEGDFLVEGVADFQSALRIISHPEWDRRWWEAEQRERERLRNKASAVPESVEFLQSLSQSVDESISTAHGAAAVQASRLGCTDAGLIRAAAGALGEALYLGKLAELALETSSHPFSIKRALFVGGRWPLGLVADRYYVF